MQRQTGTSTARLQLPLHAHIHLPVICRLHAIAAWGSKLHSAAFRSCAALAYFQIQRQTIADWCRDTELLQDRPPGSRSYHPGALQCGLPARVSYPAFALGVHCLLPQGSAAVGSCTNQPYCKHPVCCLGDGVEGCAPAMPTCCFSLKYGTACKHDQALACLSSKLESVTNRLLLSDALAACRRADHPAVLCRGSTWEWDWGWEAWLEASCTMLLAHERLS